MASITESSEHDIHKSGFLKFVNAGVILALLTSCIPDDPEGFASTQLHPSPNPDVTNVPLEEDISALPDGIEEIAPTPTVAEIVPQYTLTPEIDDFRASYIPVEELLDGSYYRWLKDEVAPTLVDEFKAREDKIKYIDVTVIGGPLGSTFMYYGAPVYEKEDVEAPWNRKVTFASTSVEQADGSILKYIILPVFFYADETQQVHPVVTVIPIRREEALEESLDWYLNVMNTSAIVYSQSHGILDKDNIVMEDPIVGQVYDRLGHDKVYAMIMQFLKGDVSAFSGEDTVMLATFSNSDAYK